ncbi:hypothetical protein HNR46_001699 [Haloferula luteola]|uniref:Peptidase C39 domain-containing protein n=1 Tax=Haloferula luteola TaxID=595692 RepID=A0A840V0D1_9BACT|nr:cysteine peptidase family C39 domain-containing protein [Haloferula luteola]MBB5351462.1 hypothetical protein [Haloferula luteola]
MNLNGLGILSAILSGAAFWLASRYAVKLPFKVWLGCSMAAVVAAIPGASFAAYYFHVLPESDGYYAFRSFRGTEGLVVLVGLAGGLLAGRLPRMWGFPVLLGVIGGSILPFIKPLIGPIPAVSYRDQWDGDVCLQSTPSTCGAAATATLLKQLGIKVTERELAREAHSYAGGTEAWYLARAARSRGVRVDFDFQSEVLERMSLPAMVGVRWGGAGHFIALLEKDGEAFVVGDPLRGREVLTGEEILDRYRLTGFQMVVRATTN